MIDKVEQLENAHWRELLRRLLSADARTRDDAEWEHAQLYRKMRGPKAESAFEVSVADAVRLLEIAVTTEFPARMAIESRMAPPVPGTTPLLICGCLGGVKSPSMTRTIESLYPRVSDNSLLECLMAILIRQQTTDSVEAFLSIARDRALPRDAVCSRLRHLDATLLVPALPLFEQDTESLLQTARTVQQLPVFKRISSADYSGVRRSLARNLDLLGSISDSSRVLLRAGLNIADPLIQLSAARALLQKDEDCGDAVIQTLAASHETRAGLFEVLEKQRQLGRFPAHFRTVDAFAAVRVADWLGFYSRISFEPERLQFVARMTRRADGGETLYFRWRYRGPKNKDYLFDAGPYAAGVDDRPFSVSTDWKVESLSEQVPHLSILLDSLEDT